MHVLLQTMIHDHNALAMRRRQLQGVRLPQSRKRSWQEARLQSQVALWAWQPGHLQPLGKLLAKLPEMGSPKQVSSAAVCLQLDLNAAPCLLRLHAAVQA